MQLTPHFALDEFLRSHSAALLGIDMTPPPVVVDALTSLATNVLEPLRTYLGVPVGISSGFRPPKLNDAIGGEDHSQHELGEAADCEVGSMTAIQLCHAAIASKVPFDQLILEFGWMHISYNPNGPQRGEVLTAYHAGGAVHYSPGLPV